MNLAQQTSGGEVLLFEPDPQAIYPIDTAAQIARVPRRRILVYCRHGLITPVADILSSGYFFDAHAIRMLQRIEYLRAVYGINLSGARMILELIEEVERLQARMSGLQQ